MSAVMSQTGASFEESLAMLTAITEVTRNASKASRGLVSIGSRLNSVVDESSSNGKALKEIYEGLNIALFDNEGQLRSSYDIFTDLAAIWPTLDKNTQNYIASVQAGTNQFQNFAALMSNFSTAAEATETALNSAGSAAQENSRYMEGLEAKTQAVKASFEALSNTVIDSGLVKGILDLANGFLQLLNSPVGVFVTQTSLLTGVLWGGTGLIQAMKLLPNYLNSAAISFNLLGKAITFGAPQLTLIAMGLSAILAIAPKVSDWFKEITNDTEYARDKLEEYNNSLSTNKEKLEELYSVPYESRTSDMWQEINVLEEENKELERNIELWKSKEAKGTLKDLRDGSYTLPQYKITGGDLPLRFSDIVNSETEAIEKLKAWGYEYENLGTKIEDFGYKLEEYGESQGGYIQYYTNLIQKNKELSEVVQNSKEVTADTRKEYGENVAALISLANTLESAKEGGALLTEEEKNLLEYVKSATIEFEKFTNATNDADNSIRILTEGGRLNQEQYEALIKVYPELIDAIEKGTYSYGLNEQALYSLAQAGNDTARNIIKAEIEATKQVIESTEQRIKAYQTELEALEQLSGKKLFGAFGPETTVSAGLNTASTLFGFRNQEDLLNSINQETENLSSAKDKLSQLLAEVNSWEVKKTSIGSSVSGSSATKAEAKEVDVIKEQSDAFKELNDIIEHNIFLKEKQGASQNELIQLYKDYQKQLHSQAEWFREQGLDDNSEYIRELQEQWWSLEDEIDSIYDEIAQDAEEAAQEAKEAWEEAMNAQIESLEKKQDAYETLFSLVSDMAQDEIDALEEQRTVVEEYWQEKIDALEKANDELEEQIEKEEALDALARARQSKVMVYKDGRFQYVQDIDQVSEAQANLEKIEREEILKKELENLEELRDKELASIDEQIEGWEKYKEAWSSVVDNYQEEQDRLLVEQELGIKLEGENWETRLENLASYVQQYKDLMAQLTGLQFDLESGNIQAGQGETTGITPGIGSLAGTQYNAWAWVPGSGYVPVTVEGGKTQQTNLPVGTIIYGDDKAWIITGGTGGDAGYTSEEYGSTPDNIWTPGKGSTSTSSGGGSGGSGSGGTSSNSGNYTGSSTTGGPSYNIGSEAGKDFINNAQPGDTITGGDGSSWTKNPDGSTTINRGDDTWVVPANANGTLSAIGGLSLVGENGPELRVLNEGDGVIPSEVTKNLWAWGATSPASMMNNIVGGLQSMGQQIGITIQNFNPNLSNVQDGQGFANYMRNNFWREAIQFAKA